MGFLKRILGPSTRQITVDNPLVIASPRIGFFNLLGSSAKSMMEEDKLSLGPLFAGMDESSLEVPTCDVLMMYARVESDGKLAGASDGLRDMIRKSGAAIVVVASENDEKNYAVAGRPTGYGQANLVLTLRRKGVAFTGFFTQLFGRMFRGKSMLLAWVELAPQIPGKIHENCPESIFAAEISHIIFK